MPSIFSCNSDIKKKIHLEFGLQAHTTRWPHPTSNNLATPAAPHIAQDPDQMQRGQLAYRSPINQLATVTSLWGKQTQVKKGTDQAGAARQIPRACRAAISAVLHAKNTGNAALHPIILKTCWKPSSTQAPNP